MYLFKQVSISARTPEGLSKDHLHESVIQAHHADYQTVHAERENNNSLVEPNQSIILDQSLAHQPSLNNPDEIVIQCSINKQIDALFASVPDFVDMDESFRSLKTCRNP